jgi:hypothetical protein
MILVILAGMAGLWLAGNHHRAGWGLAAAAHLLWLPYALAAGQPGVALAVAAFGLICLRNYRCDRRQYRAGLLTPRVCGSRR